jgi:N-acyl-D-aspartate/D-glutamate deacylase
VVRENGALWQATPPKDSVINTIKTFLLTSGRLHKKPLRTTVVAALDVSNNWKILRLAKLLAIVLNSKIVQGNFHLQALGAPFKVWADGAITPLSEEIPELRKLNETDLEDRAARLTILSDSEYIKTFKAMWLKGKQGWGLARLKRIMNLEDYAFNRNLNDMMIEGCPIGYWVGMNMQQLLDRIIAIKSGEIPNDINDQELEVVKRDFFWISDEADFMLQIFRTFDLDLSWSIITANRNPKTTRELLMNPLLIPGFNDCGAHLTNMAFYDVNLRSLKLASSGGDKDITYLVKRLTKDAADLFGVKAGTINEGDTADLILVDPEALANYDGEANVIRQFRKAYNNDQLVNRSDGVVPLVMIAGNVAWENDDFNGELGEKPMGRLLRSSAM